MPGNQLMFTSQDELTQWLNELALWLGRNRRIQAKALQIHDKRLMVGLESCLQMASNATVGATEM
jgi:hypothetical protein